ncbi:MAG: hypothetical protein ACREDM_00105 [Methylocella sp.]
MTRSASACAARVCLDCAARHPQFRPLAQPALVQQTRCPVCGDVKACVPNRTVGLPEKFLTVDEAFRLMAGIVKGELS